MLSGAYLPFNGLENPKLRRFQMVSFTSLFNWSTKLVPFSQPIRCKTKTNCNLIMGVVIVVTIEAVIAFSFVLQRSIEMFLMDA